MTAFDIFYRQLIELQGYKNVLVGLKNTALIAVFGLFIGMIVGCLLATCKILPRNSRIIKILSGVVDVYVALFRGTPMVVQLLLIHFVIFPSVGVDISSVYEAILVFGLNSAAYVAEIIRGGILSVDIGQTEAGRALGLPHGVTLIKIVIPQAIKNVIPAIGNELIALIKETSIVSMIGMFDLTMAAKIVGSGNNMASYIVPMTVVALFYLAIVYILTFAIKIIEKRLRASDKR